MIAWWDCSVAAAGDMLLAAHLDAGADRDTVVAGLGTLGLRDWGLDVEQVHRQGFRALRIQVRSNESGHVHRPWAEIRARITESGLPEGVRRRALAAYGRLAACEARLHGVDVEAIELHEVGAVDAIVDIVGVCLCLEDLGVTQVIATPLPMGTGSVRSAHGPLPLPAPATVELVRGWPTVPSRWPGEWVTPTGAALVTSLATAGDWPEMVVQATGFGAGTRDPSEVANLVRVVLGGTSVGDAVVELQANIDDQSGELLAPVLTRLLDAGALDAWMVPVLMKKGRPGVVVHALARQPDAERLSDVLLRHSSTLGVRRVPVRRRVLDRWFDTVETRFGAVRVKVGGRDGESWHAAPEFADVARVAEAADVPVHEVHRAALAAWDLSDKG